MAKMTREQAQVFFEAWYQTGGQRIVLRRLRTSTTRVRLDPDELRQQAAVKFWAAYRNCEVPNPHALAGRILVNLICDEMRHCPQMSSLPDEDLIQETRRTEREAMEASRAAITELQAACDYVGGKPAEIVRAYATLWQEYNGIEYELAAQRLGVTAHAIRDAIYRFKLRLKKAPRFQHLVPVLAWLAWNWNEGAGAAVSQRSDPEDQDAKISWVSGDDSVRPFELPKDAFADLVIAFREAPSYRKARHLLACSRHIVGVDGVIATAFAKQCVANFLLLPRADEMRSERILRSALNYAISSIIPSFGNLHTFRETIRVFQRGVDLVTTFGSCSPKYWEIIHGCLSVFADQIRNAERGPNDNRQEELKRLPEKLERIVSEESERWLSTRGPSHVVFIELVYGLKMIGDLHLQEDSIVPQLMRRHLNRLLAMNVYCPVQHEASLFHKALSWLIQGGTLDCPWDHAKALSHFRERGLESLPPG